MSLLIFLGIICDKISAQEAYHRADSLSYLHFQKQSYDSAAVYAKEALQILEQEYGRKDSLYADMLHKIVYIYYYKGDYERAIYYSKDEIVIREIVQGKNNFDYCVSVALLGELYTRNSQYQEALPLFLEALEIAENEFGKEDPNYGYHLGNLAWVYSNLGRYEDALLLHLEALEHIERALGREHINYGTRLSHISLVYQEMGQYQKALPFSIEALEITEKAYGKEHSEYARNLNNLALIYKHQGQHQEALFLFLEAVDLTERTQGKDHPLYGLRLQNLASEYHALGQYQEALPLFLESVQNCEKTLGKDNYQYGLRLSSLALLYQDIGQYQEALLLFMEALELTEKSLGIEHPSYGTRLGNLARCYLDLDQFDEAYSCYLNALENTEKALGKDHPIYGVRLNELATFYNTTGKYDLAVQYYQEALTISEKTQGKKHSQYGVFLTNLASTYEEQGHYKEALPLLIEALNLCEDVYGKEHPNYGIQLRELGSLYRSMGYYDKALPLFTEALDNCEKNHGGDDTPCGGNISSLALLYKDMGQYRKALPLYIKALENTEKIYGKDHSSYGRSLYHLAGIYQSLGQYYKSIELYNESLENCERTLGKAHYQYGIRLNNLAAAYGDLDQKGKAIELYLEALEITEIALGKNHAYYGVLSMNIAAVYRDLEQFEKAISLFDEAQANLEKSLGKEHSDYSVLLINISSLYKAMGQDASTPEEKMKMYLKAIPLAYEALEICENSFGREHPNYGRFQSTLASIYSLMAESSASEQQENDYYQNALSLYNDAIENANYHIDQNFAYLSEKEKEAYFNSVNTRFDRYNAFALDTKDQFEEITARVYNNTVRNKSILLKSSTAMRSAIFNSGDSVLVARYDQWTDLKKDIVKLSSIPVARRQVDISQLEEQATVLERELVSSSQEFYAFTQTLKTGWKDVKDALEPNEAAIEFVHFQDQDTILYCALIVCPESEQPDMVALCREEELEKIMGSEEINSPAFINGLYGQDSEKSTALYRLIWAPIDSTLDMNRNMEHLPAGTRQRLFISPSGLLHRISFPAIAGDHDVHLCDVYDIEVKNTTAGIIENQEMARDPSMTRATLFGGINYNTDSSMVRVWNYLDGTKSETEKIEKILKKKYAEVDSYSDYRATEGRFKEKAGNSTIMHVATHGFFYPDPIEINKEVAKGTGSGSTGFGTGLSIRGAGSRGYGRINYVENEDPLMRSGLVFAGANDVWSQQTESKADDGVLSAQEVIQIDMRNTELVVLSACESGLGDIVGSEGVYGLQRAFKMAGVQYLIMSLWQVPDQETEVLMTTFYKNLIRSKDIRMAFEKTQKKMRKKHDPYAWAAFVLID